MIQKNIKADRVNTVIVNLHQINIRCFFGTPNIPTDTHNHKQKGTINFF